MSISLATKGVLRAKPPIVPNTTGGVTGTISQPASIAGSVSTPAQITGTVGGS